MKTAAPRADSLSRPPSRFDHRQRFRTQAQVTGGAAGRVGGSRADLRARRRHVKTAGRFDVPPRPLARVWKQSGHGKGWPDDHAGRTEETVMHPTISYQLAQGRIADLRQHARENTLARAARRATAGPDTPDPPGRPWNAGCDAGLHLGPCSRSPRWAAAVAFVDATIVNIAFPNIERSFPGTSLSTLSWVLNAYNIVFAAFLVAAAADRRPARAAARLRLRPGAVHRRARCSARSRRRPAALIAVPGGAGARRRLPRALLAGAGAEGVPAGASLPRRCAAVGGRGGRGRPRPVARRTARLRRELAAGVPGQRADRGGGGRARPAAAGREPRAGPSADARPARARCCSRSRSQRSCSASSRARSGAGAARGSSAVRRRARARRGLRLALHVAPFAGPRPVAAAHPRRSASPTR